MVSFSVLISLFVLSEIECSIYKNVKYFDTLHASEMSHSVVKRGLKESNHPYNKIKEVKFSTLGKNFRLFLTPRKGILHSNFQAYSVDGDGKEKSVFVDHENFFNGRVFGETWSDASVHLENGLMTATIQLPDETYHIEPSWRHLPHLDNQTMVTYRASDVRFSWEQDGQAHKPCAYVKEETGQEDDDEDDNSLFKEDWEDGIKIRAKRQSDQHEFTKNRCSLLLVADYRFYKEMGGRSTTKTINYLISVIDRVDKIYNATIWHDHEGKNGFKGMGFVIKKIIVHNETTKVQDGRGHYNMKRDKWDVKQLLEVFSREMGHKDFCLAHLFTDRMFDGGVLGLAYVGSPRRNSVGGICTPEHSKNGYTVYLNTGLTSSRNHFGNKVITKEADLVTAHEFGHNWGSDHDPDNSDCSPDASQGGFFLMHTYSVSGNDDNHKKFSPCSLRSIREVLKAKSRNCFSEPQASLCGDLKIEGDEECDAVVLGAEDNDPCCDKGCKLNRTQGAVCSDKNSPCCQNCQFMSAGSKCREANDGACEQESLCTGTSAECPRSPPMSDETACVERGQCRNGTCVPYCETHGLQSCMCDIIGDACKHCCRKNLNETCYPVNPLDILQDGTPCIQGFCNKGICEKPLRDMLERFWDIIEGIGTDKFLLFLRDNVVGTVIIVTAMIWVPSCCVISYFDRRRLRREENCIKWKLTTGNNFYYSADFRRIAIRRVPLSSVQE